VEENKIVSNDRVIGGDRLDLVGQRHLSEVKEETVVPTPILGKINQHGMQGSRSLEEGEILTACD